jgi:hypothetical protein
MRERGGSKKGKNCERRKEKKKKKKKPARRETQAKHGTSRFISRTQTGFPHQF